MVSRSYKPLGDPQTTQPYQSIGEAQDGVVELHRAPIVQGGVSPHRDPTFHRNGAPDGFRITSVSTTTDKDGEVVKQRFTTERDPVRFDPARSIVEALSFNTIKPAPSIPAPIDHQEDLMTVVPIGDPHIGLMTSSVQDDEDWDTDKGLEILDQALRVVELDIPKSQIYALVVLGDLFHVDNPKMTTTSGTQLDGDPRLQSIFRKVIDTFKVLVNRALTRHQQVLLVMLPGNHDRTVTGYLVSALQQYWINNPRVTVVDTIHKGWWSHRWGDNVLFANHSDKKSNPNKLYEVITTEFRHLWGMSKRSYCYLGHLHQRRLETKGSTTMEWFNTLTPKDGYSIEHGYCSNRSITTHVWHKNRLSPKVQQYDVEEIRAAFQRGDL